MTEESTRRTLAEKLGEGPLSLAEALAVALDVLAAAEERWTSCAAPSRIDPAAVVFEPTAGRGARRISLGSVAVEGPTPDRQPVPPGVRAIVELLATALGAPMDVERAAAGLPAPIRPLVLRSLAPGGSWPIRTYGNLRDALWNVLHLLDPAAVLGPEPRSMTMALHRPGADGTPWFAMPAGVVRRVQLDARGKTGTRDAAWCVAAGGDGRFVQAVLVVDPEERDGSHHARTLRSLWPGAELTAWHLPPPEPDSTPDTPVFRLRPETILVLEPLRLFEATAVAGAHDVGCPLHVLAVLAEGTGGFGAPLLTGRLADAALRGLLEHPERSDLAIVGDAIRSTRTDAIWLRSEAELRRAEGALRAAVPRIRAWLDRRAAGPEAMNEVTRLSRRFGVSGRSDFVLPRPDAPPAIGELKSGQARRFGAPAPAAGVDALRGGHVAQARLDALLWTDAWLAARPEATGGGTRGRVTAELFYAASGEAYRIGPEPREVSRVLATRNAMVDALRRAAEGEPPPAPPLAASCDRCFQRDTCPSRNAADRDGVERRGTPHPAEDGAAYGRHFSRELFRAIWHGQHLRRQQLEPSTLPARVAALTAEDGLELRFDPQDDRAASLAGELRGALRTGDGRRMLVHRGDAAGLEAFEADIERVEPRAYRLALPWPRPPWLSEGGGWVAEEGRSFENEREGFEGLARLARRRDPALVAALLAADRGGTDSRSTPDASRLAVPAAPFPGGWHPSQHEALDRALNGDILELVQGPPGTGKTIFVGALVAALVRAGRRVLVGALTHGAVDQAGRRIVEAGVRDLLRVGARPGPSVLTAALETAGVEPAGVLLEELARRARHTTDVRNRLLTVPVLLATCHRLGRLPWRSEVDANGEPPFDVAVLDEATQIAEPTALATLTLARRAVLVGDPMQLSCVEPGEAEWAPEPPTHPGLAAAGIAGLGRSLLERLCAIRGSRMLREQHRMHPRIMALPNRAFYGGALEAAPEVRERLLELDPRRAGSTPAWLQTVLQPEEPLVLVDVPGGSDDRLNAREAALVAEAAAALRRAGLAPERLGVVTPYRAQVGLVRRLFAGVPELAAIPVDTVERFQGDERDAILVSLVGGRPTGHLAHPNRLNVTLTRARSKLVVFGDATGLSRDPLLAELVRQPETTRVRAP